MAPFFEKLDNGLGPIRGQSLAGAVSKQLQQMILSGRILPGERINESHLASVFEVSRGPIREACRQLEKYGLVEFRENQGTFVKNISLDEALELYDIRAALEALAAEKAAELLQKKDFDKLQKHIATMKTLSESNDLEGFFKENVDFHFTLFEISGNTSLLSFLEIISKKISLFRKNTFLQPRDLSISLKEHNNILEALKKKNGRKAAQLMKKHVLKGKYIIQESISASPQ